MKGKMMKRFAYLFILFFVAAITVNCGGGGGGTPAQVQDTVNIVADTYPANTNNITVTVDDILAADTTVDVIASKNGDLDPAQVLTLSIALDSDGFGAAELSIDPGDLVDGDVVSVHYTDGAGTDLTDSASIIAEAVAPFLAADDNLDGKAYLYATNSKIEIDIDDDTMMGAGLGDFAAIQDWSYSDDDVDNDAILDGEFAGDITYDKVFAVTPGVPGWSSVVFAGPFGTDFMTGLTGDYSALHFKFKGANYATVKVGFAGASEVVFRVTSEYAEALGDGWYSFSIPISVFGDLSAVTDYYIITDGVDDWYLTDIYFDDTVIAGPPYTDLGDDGKFYIKSGDGSNQIDLIYDSAYTVISVWDTNGATVGAGLSDTVDATHGDTWTVATGNGWGGPPFMGVLAFASFDPLFAANFTTLNFRYKSSDFNYVNVVFSAAATAENGFDMVTYGTQIGATEWYDVSVPLAQFGSMSASTEFAFKVYGGAELQTFEVTDIYFE